mmetsp:Transcript_69475/g.195948  ORF Transcript_69475/g.195948 Transcript_69475/m.195948 type:complete len:212 (+) Transcript_69475:382-1017(+)
MPLAVLSWLFVTVSKVIGYQTTFFLARSVLQRTDAASCASLSSLSRSSAGSAAVSPAGAALIGQKRAPFSSRMLWFLFATRHTRVSCSDTVMSVHRFLLLPPMKPKVPLISSATGPWSGSISTCSTLPPNLRLTHPSMSSRPLRSPKAAGFAPGFLAAAMREKLPRSFGWVPARSPRSAHDDSVRAPSWSIPWPQSPRPACGRGCMAAESA